MNISTKKSAVLYSVITGVVSGILSLLVFNFWESNFPVNTGYIIPPIILFVIFLIYFLRKQKGLLAKEKIINSIIFIPLHLLSLFGVLISVIIFALSRVGW